LYFLLLQTLLQNSVFSTKKGLAKYSPGKLYLPTFAPFIIKINDNELFYLKSYIFMKILYEVTMYLIGATRPICKLCIGAQKFQLNHY